MAIDIANEELLTPAGAAKRLPNRRAGRPIHISTVHRWMTTGVRGVVLESIRIGGALHTSLEALQRFADHLTTGDTSGVSVRTSRQRERAVAQAEAELSAARI